MFTVRGTKTYLNGQEFLVKGLRCSNALISDQETRDLIDNLDTFAGYGVNTVSVYFMGSRFGDVKGYNEDATLNPVYAARMGRIIEAADQRGMVVLVGCLYWSTSQAKWDRWTQAEANAAVANTVAWLKEKGYRNVFVDIDNEGMARQPRASTRQMVLAGKAADPCCVIATNFRGEPPAEADLAIHHSERAAGKPYIESEASPGKAPGGYWGCLQQEGRLLQLHQHRGLHRRHEGRPDQADEGPSGPGRGIHAGLDLAAMRRALRSEPSPGGNGTEDDPGVRWWLEFLRDNYGPRTAHRPAHDCRNPDRRGRLSDRLCIPIGPFLVRIRTDVG